MIQRIQTVYLLLILGLMVTMPFLPVAHIKVSDKPELVDLKLWESILSAVLALAAIVLFKNRKAQLMTCYAILELLALSYVFVVFDLWVPTQSYGTVAFEAPIVFPFFAVVLDVLAILAIRKDEKLVRAADRLR